MSTDPPAILQFDDRMESTTEIAQCSEKLRANDRMEQTVSHRSEAVYDKQQEVATSVAFASQNLPQILSRP